MGHVLSSARYLVASFAVVCSFAARAAVVDNFSDMNDTANPVWAHLDGYVGSDGQSWDASTGQYRFQAANNGAGDFGFIGSHVGETFTDVVVRADVVGFIDDPAAQGGTFGVAARLNGQNGLGELGGYGYAYEPYAAGGAGEMVLYRINPGIDVDDIGSQRVTLDPTRDYTIVLEVRGNELHGQVFDIATGEMVAERFATDELNAYPSGYSGLFAYSQIPVPPVDVTWDNFSTDVVPEPGAGLLIALAGVAALGRRRSCRS
jgi:hypothetical protein